MKSSSILFGLLLLVSSNIFSKTFEIESSRYINRNIEEILDIAIDYHNYCHSGCKYKLTDVKELKILEWINENEFFTWAHVSGLKTFKYYNYVKIERFKNSMRVRTIFPKSADLKYLKNKYGLTHNPAFQDSESEWYFKAKSDDKTYVKYTGSYQMSSWLAAIVGNMTKKVLDQTTVDLLDALE